MTLKKRRFLYVFPEYSGFRSYLGVMLGLYAACCLPGIVIGPKAFLQHWKVGAGMLETAGTSTITAVKCASCVCFSRNLLQNEVILPQEASLYYCEVDSATTDDANKCHLNFTIALGSSLRVPGQAPPLVGECSFAWYQVIC